MSKTITEFHIPEDESIEVGSLVWHYYLCSLRGPLLVVDTRHAGYRTGRRKRWVLFDSSKNEYYQAAFNELRIPKERICN